MSHPRPNIPALPPKPKSKYKSYLVRPAKNLKDRKMSTGPRTIKSYTRKPRARKSSGPTPLQIARANNRLIKDEERIAKIKHKLARIHDNTRAKINVFINKTMHQEQAQANRLNSQLTFLSIPHKERDYAGMRAARKVSADASRALKAEAKTRAAERSRAALAKRQAKTARIHDTHLVTPTEAKVLRTVDKSIRSGRRISKERYAYLTDLVRVDTIRFPDF